MTGEERRRIEERLDARLEELLRARAAVAHSDNAAGDSELSRLDNHPGDSASELHDEELDETARVLLEVEQRRIAEAQQALADGTYGSCRECGRPIPAERLDAMPEAVRCIDCQRHLEGSYRQRNRA